MHDDHLRWPVGSALKPGDQALGPLPYAGDVNGFWLGRGRRNPLLLGKAPLRSGQDFGLGGNASEVFFFISQCTTEHAVDAWRTSIAASHTIAQAKVSRKS